jgi:hypothetical protein
MLLTLLALASYDELRQIRERTEGDPDAEQVLGNTLFAVQAACLVLAWPLAALVFARKRLPVPFVLTVGATILVLLTDPWSYFMVGLCLVFALTAWILWTGNRVEAPMQAAAWALGTSDRSAATEPAPEQPTLF